MKHLKIFGICLMALLGLTACGKQEEKKAETKLPDRTAYLDAEAYGTGFAAVGTEGRFDLIGTDGTITKLESDADCELLSLAVNAEHAVAAGEDGTVVVLTEENDITVYSAKVSTDLYSVSFFNGNYFFGTENGRILKTSDFQTWETVEPGLLGTVTGLAANEERCILVTDQGETATTTDGENWSLLNYNEYYSENISFRNLESCGSGFVALGDDETGMERGLETLEGGVWAERGFLTQEEEENGMTPAKVSSVCWDGEQAYGARLDGQVLTMPSCTKCNKTQQVGEGELYAAACNEKFLLFAGENYEQYVLDAEAVRQSKIKAEAAYEKQQNGALLVDVRDEEDYMAGRIPGAVRMDVEKVAEELPMLCPNQEKDIIFYCYSGKRSQEALEIAQELGYQNVYNLGSIDDWTFELLIPEN